MSEHGCGVLITKQFRFSLDCAFRKLIILSRDADAAIGPEYGEKSTSPPPAFQPPKMPVSLVGSPVGLCARGVEFVTWLAWATNPHDPNERPLVLQLSAGRAAFFMWCMISWPVFEQEKSTFGSFRFHTMSLGESWCSCNKPDPVNTQVSTRTNSPLILTSFRCTAIARLTRYIWCNGTLMTNPLMGGCNNAVRGLKSAIASLGLRKHRIFSVDSADQTSRQRTEYLWLCVKILC